MYEPKYEIRFISFENLEHRYACTVFYPKEEKARDWQIKLLRELLDSMENTSVNTSKTAADFI